MSTISKVSRNKIPPATISNMAAMFLLSFARLSIDLLSSISIKLISFQGKTKPSLNECKQKIGELGFFIGEWRRNRIEFLNLVVKLTKSFFTTTIYIILESNDSAPDPTQSKVSKTKFTESS